MIQITNDERRVNNIAVKEIKCKIFGIQIYSNIHTTTNNNIVRQLTEMSNKTEIKGFNYENKD
jgi:hypothetical protein